MNNETKLNLSADIIDVRDIIARINDIDLDTPETLQEKWDNGVEYDLLLEILDELKGNGGDEQWRGDWYPLVLIRDSHFKDYIRELLAECGDISAKLPNYVVVDWDATARNFHVDYSTIEIDGATYWYR